MREYATNANDWKLRNAGRLVELRGAAASARSAIAELRGHARSGDGTVAVSVDVSGNLQLLEFAPSSAAVDRKVLAQSVVSTIEAAKAAAAIELSRLVTSMGANPGAQEMLALLTTPDAVDESTKTDDDEEGPWGWSGILKRA